MYYIKLSSFSSQLSAIEKPRKSRTYINCIMAEPTTSEMVGGGGGEEKQLRYLEFIQAAVIYFMVCFSVVYEFAKDNSGPLKPGVESVEATVKTVIGPVYHKFADVPFQLLRFADLKVAESVREAEKHVPWVVKQASSQARALAGEVQRAGVVETVKDVATTVYVEYEPVAEQYVAVVWRWLNRLPLFPQVVDVAVPTAAYWAHKYNHGVYCAAARGYSVAEHLPLIPVDEISKVFEDDHSEEDSTSNLSTAEEPPLVVQ